MGDRAPLVITPGDPQGIGPEVAAKAARALELDAILVGDAEAIARWADPLPRVDAIGPVRGLAIYEPAGAPGPDQTGDPEPVEVASIRAAARACLDGRARALVTGPIHKGRLMARGFRHPGHTTFLGELCGVERPVMAFTGGKIRVALVTVHLPLSAVSAAITPRSVLHTIHTARRALTEQLQIADPHILVCGLNPHAGDGGALGREEIAAIGPACEIARAGGARVEGPISAEAAFRRAAAGGCDLVVAMYHDQGLVPLKMVDFGRSVNWTLGLPIVRTSVDHGTADDIAGQGIADPGSMVSAIELALRLS